MAKSVTGRPIHGEEECFSRHDEGAKGKAPTSVKVQGVGYIPPLDDDDDHGRIEEVAVKIVEDEQALFATVTNLLVDVWLIDPATCR